jgi:hypothetical protein
VEYQPSALAATQFYYFNIPQAMLNVLNADVDSGNNTSAGPQIVSALAIGPSSSWVVVTSAGLVNGTYAALDNALASDINSGRSIKGVTIGASGTYAYIDSANQVGYDNIPQSLLTFLTTNAESSSPSTLTSIALGADADGVLNDASYSATFGSDSYLLGGATGNGDRAVLRTSARHR